MSRENVEIVRDSIRAWGKGDFESALRAYDPQVVFDLRHLPGGAIYRGRDGVAEAMRLWTEAWDDWSVEVLELIDAGDAVIFHAREFGRGKGSGVPIEHEVFPVFTLSQGLIVRWEAFFERSQALAAAGLEE